MCNTDHPAAAGVNHGEAKASHTEKLVNTHGTPAPHSADHGEADRLSIGHKPRVKGGAKGSFYRR